MKNLIPLILCVLLFNCKKQDHNKYYFKANNIEGLKDSTKVYLFNYDLYKVVDSTFVKNKSFEFTGTIEFPFDAAIGIPSEKITVKFWMEEGEVILGNIEKKKLKSRSLAYSHYIKSKELSQIIKDYKERTGKYQKKKV